MKIVGDQVFAIDAVILPSAEVSKLAILLSHKLELTSPISLNPENYLPHISLVMGYISDISLCRKVMLQALKKVGSITITLESIFRSPKDFQGYYFYHLVAQKEKKLQQLHEYLVDNLPLIDVVNPKVKYYLPDADGIIVPAVFNYVAGFKKNASKNNYWPHITLGAGPENMLKDVKLPLKFTVNHIHLCQLGNFCTCRKILI